MRVLIIEDEARLARNIAQVLNETAGFAVDICLRGTDGLHMAQTNPFDLVILDLSLPDLDGMEILARLRGAGKRTPVLILTARDTPGDIVRGLDAGSDDYLTKPFEMAEFVARCRALIRRAYDRPDPRLSIGELTIDTIARQVRIANRSIHLTAMEYRTLEYLALRAGQVVSKEDLLEHLYDFNWERFSNVLEVYISSLRRKLDPDRALKLLQTVHGQGYVLGPDHA
jgi:two-component system response regulator PhoP